MISRFQFRTLFKLFVVWWANSRCICVSITWCLSPAFRFVCSLSLILFTSWASSVRDFFLWKRGETRTLWERKHTNDLIFSRRSQLYSLILMFPFSGSLLCANGRCQSEQSDFWTLQLKVAIHELKCTNYWISPQNERFMRSRLWLWYTNAISSPFDLGIRIHIKLIDSPQIHLSCLFADTARLSAEALLPITILWVEKFRQLILAIESETAFKLDINYFIA